MKVSALWYGGYSFSAPLIIDYLEIFDSIAEAEQEFIDRYNNISGQYPCVSDNTEMHIFKGIDIPINEPDLIISIGKRGGIKRKRV